MKILKILGIIILILVLLIGGFIILGPSSGHLERTQVIQASSEVVFAEVSNLKTFNKWSPWFMLDPDAEYVWEGPSRGEGAKMTWYSDDENVGNGYMEITEARQNEFVSMDMGFDQNGNRDFTDEGEERPKASFVLVDQGEETSVTWTFDITGVSGFEKMFVLGLDQFLGPFYDQGLDSLKKRVESRPVFDVVIDVAEVEPVNFVGMEVSSSTNPEEIGQAMGEAYGKVMAGIQKANLEMQGYPLAVATSYDENNISMVCGVPVTEGAAIDSEGLEVQQTPGGQAVKAIHLGAYENLETTHNAIDSYVNYYGYEVLGMPWEIYVTDPSQEQDTAKWITEVYYPVQ